MHSQCLLGRTPSRSRKARSQGIIRTNPFIGSNPVFDMSSTLDASLDDRIPKNSRVTSFTEESLREVFDQYDEQSTGFIDEPALTKLCAQLGLDEGDVPQIMIELDSDLDGKVGGF